MVENLRKLVEQIAKESIEEHGKFYVGFSGGSLTKWLCTILPTIETEWAKWMVFFCDERHVPDSDEDSTFGYYKKNLLPKVPLSENQFVTIDSNDPVEKCAADYEAVIRSEFNEPTGIPQFDLLLLGMGPDGHTCSLFPGHPLLNENKLLIAPISDSPKPPPKRITMTYPLINNAKYSIFAISGAGKADIIKVRVNYWFLLKIQFFFLIPENFR